MKTKIGILVLALCTTFFTVQAQRRVVTTTRATSYDISDNLDLDAVASIFGDSENLEDFEHRLNDPDNRISNLDLNEDGYIDYLRVVENSSDRNSLVVVQAVLDRDVFQDVATIEVERISNGNPRIQIVGDAYIYGSNYIIEPVFYRTPIIFSFFWGPRYSPWQSPYYWNNYPRWYSTCSPYSPFKYRKHIYAHINYENKYRRADSRNIHFSNDNYSRIRRNDYANSHPERAFESRHQGVNNRSELMERRSNRSGGEYQRDNNAQRPNSRVRPGSENAVQKNYKKDQTIRENQRPVYRNKSGSDQTRTKEYNSNSNRNRPSNNGELQQKSESRNQTYEKRTSPERRSVSTPDRQKQQVESPQKDSAPGEKSGSVSNRSRSNSEVKQNNKSSRRSEPVKSQDTKETENNSRR
jgi:hypothetical protein